MEKEKKNTVKKAADKKPVAVANKQKAKKLNIANLEKENKKLDVKNIETVVVDGTEYTFECDQFFRSSKQEAVLNDLLSYYEKVDELGTDMLAFATPYVALLMIKHFTSIDVPNDFDEAVHVLNALLDLGLLDAILEKMPDSEVTKLNATLQSAMEVFLENLEKNEQELAKIIEENQIENEEILDTLPQAESDSEPDPDGEPETPLN